MSRPPCSGALAASAARSGRWERSALWTASARSAPRTATCTWSPNTSWRGSTQGNSAIRSRVLRVVDERALGVGERVRARAREPRPAGDAGGERAAGAVELVAGLGDRGAHRRGGLDLRGGQLRAHRDDVAELGAHARGLGSRSSVSGSSSISSSSTPIV